MVFGALKGLMKNGLNKYSGNLDYLQAVAAACARVAAAEDGISQEEEDQALLVAMENEVLMKNFKPAEIEEEFRRQFGRTRTEAGKKRLDREIEDMIQKPIELREDVYAVALDVAKEDGEVGPKEKDELRRLARVLHVDAYI